MADRAVLNQISEMVVDLALPANPPTTSASAPAITKSIGAKESENPLEPDEDVASPFSRVNSVGTALPASTDDPECGRAAFDRDDDNVNDSDTASSESASAAGDSLEDTDSKGRLRATEGTPFSGVGRDERLGEADSERETASEGESIRCD